MTLRARLTAAFLTIVLGPVLLGTVIVAGTVTAVNRDRVRDQLALAVTGVRGALGVLCQQLYAAAQAAAVASDAGRAADSARTVAGGLADVVWLDRTAGGPVFGVVGGPPPATWWDCADAHPRRTGAADGPPPGAPGASPPGAGAAGGRSSGSGLPEPGAPAPGRSSPADPARTPVSSVPGPDAKDPGPPPTALGARYALRGADGARTGYAYAAWRLDRALLDRLARAGGAGVTVLSRDGAPVLSTEREPDRTRVAGAAARVPHGSVASAGAGRYVRRMDAAGGQPLTLALSVRGVDPGAWYPLLAVGFLLLSGLAALAVWRLARATTRPLAELTEAVDRVAGGHLEVRVPVRTADEVGHLAATFNRMTREMQDYVHALTASRDQLRGSLALIGDTLAGTHDLQRILRVILQTALASTGAQAGIVLLLDRDSGLLVGQCGEGLAERGPGRDGADPAGLRLALGEGLLGAVAATGEPRRGHVDRDRLRLSPKEPRCRTYVAVPLAPPPGPAGTDEPVAVPNRAGEPSGVPELPLDRAPDPAVGVLALYDRHGRDEFDDADLVTLRTFAGQAAVAVHNVWVHREAQRLSLTDPLTGLFNYRYLRDSIRREVERASRFGRRLSVLALDLDRFKEVNDTYGHASGDAVLVEFARRVRAEIREVDLAFRQGGEEFVVLLPETDASGAAVVAQRLGAVIRDTPVRTMPLPGDEPADVFVTVSIGIAVFPDHAGTGTGLLRAADDALYAAKSAGRDLYKLAGPGGVRPVPGQSVTRQQARGGASAGPQPPRPPVGG